MRRLRSWTAQLFLIGLGILLSFILLEGLLHLHTAFGAPPAPPAEPIVPDERLGHRPNPAFPGHDARGWRNAAAVAQADVVALGDSQTYGINAATDEAWPQRLAIHLRRSVYQMAYGGYGPAHYVPVLHEALTLRPKVIFASYYFGNDIYDAYWLVYRIGEVGRHKRFSSDPAVRALATSDPGIRATIARVESSDPKDPRVGYLDCSRPRVNPYEEIEKQTPVLRAGPRRIVLQLAYRSLLFRTVWPRMRPRLTFVLGELPVPRELPVLGDYGPPLCVHYRDGAVRTVFNVGYRFVILDDSDPREVEGERISLLALKHLAERCRRAGIQFYVLLLPTKETAFRVRAEVSLRHESLLVDLWQAEARARRRAMAFFTRAGINVVDTLPALEALIASGINPYLESADGHPAAPGYDAIARAVAARLKKDRVWRQ